ncbi:MAG: hypothetical protein RIR18_2418, partial [Pseudomonadota bacterium]
MTSQIDEFTVAAIQMVSTPRVAENLAVAADLIAEAVAGGARLVALPEYFPLIGATDVQRLDARESEQGGPIQSWLAEMAAKHSIYLFGGSIPLRANTADKMLNTMLVFNPEGQPIGRYDKIHLFSFEQGSEKYCEADIIEAGPPKPVVVDTALCRVGLSICYDLRFPELYRAMIGQ